MISDHVHTCSEFLESHISGTIPNPLPFSVLSNSDLIRHDFQETTITTERLKLTLKVDILFFREFSK